MLTQRSPAADDRSRPAFPPAPVDRAPAPRLRILGALDALAALAAAVLLLAWPVWFPVAPAAASGRVSLPARFAPYARLTAGVRTSPAGRAIALYESGSSELFTTWQTLVAGADRDTYRTVSSGGDPAPDVRLSPDGEQVLFHRDGAGTDAFTLLDLTTGGTRVLHSVPWHSNVAGLDVLAWSPDGRYVAYAVPAPPPADGTAAGSFFDGRPIRQLAILDVVRDSSTRYGAIGPVWGAAFAPDGRTLAVQLGHQAWIIGSDGRRLRQVPLPTGADLVPNTAWSPDGALLAVTDGGGIGFVDATGTGRRVPGRLPYDQVLGWWGPASLLSVLRDHDGDVGVVEVDARTGRRRVLSRFSTARACEHGTQRCGTYRMQLATGLVAAAEVRPSDPRRGPWPRSTRVAATGLAAAGCLVAGWAGRVIRRRRGSRRVPGLPWRGERSRTGRS